MENLHHHILGIYSSKHEAEQTRQQLLQLGLNDEQLNLIEPGDVPVGAPSKLRAGELLTNIDIPHADLEQNRVFSDLIKKALIEGRIVLLGHTTTEEQTERAQGVLNSSMKRA